MQPNRYINKTVPLERLYSAGEWILNSHKATGEKGSAAYYSPVLFAFRKTKWAFSYPETTGYIIPSLLSIGELSRDARYTYAALKMADWLLGLQATDGSLPSGDYRGFRRQASVFNTAQILKGLIAAYKYSCGSKFLDAAVAAGQWLMNVQDLDGGWSKYALRKDFSPSYYSEVCWPMIALWEICGDNNIRTAAIKGLHFIMLRQKETGVISGWGFEPGSCAFTHTIGYTINGLLQSALILHDEGTEIWNAGVKAAQALLNRQELDGTLAGIYSETLKPNKRFVCLTGNCQMAICWHTIYQKTRSKQFLTAGQMALRTVIKSQYMPKHSHENKGGIPGSAPIWGKYMKFKYPNWAAKYFIDAMMQFAQDLG